MFYKKFLQFSLLTVLSALATGCGEAPMQGTCAEGKWGGGEKDRYRFFVVRNQRPLKLETINQSAGKSFQIPNLPNLPNLNDITSGKVKVGALPDGVMARVNSPVRTEWIWGLLIILVCIAVIVGAIICLVVTVGVCAAPILAFLGIAGTTATAITGFLSGGMGAAIILGAGTGAVSQGISSATTTVKDLTYDFQVHLDSGPNGGDNKGTPFENFKPYSEDSNGILFTTCQAACFQLSDLAIQKITQMNTELEGLLKSSNVVEASIPKDEASIQNSKTLTSVQKLNLQRYLLIKERVTKLKAAIAENSIKEAIKSCEQLPVHYNKGDSAETVSAQMNAVKSAEGCHQCGKIDPNLFTDFPGANAIDNIFNGNLNESNKDVPNLKSTTALSLKNSQKSLPSKLNPSQISTHEQSKLNEGSNVTSHLDDATPSESKGLSATVSKDILDKNGGAKNNETDSNHLGSGKNSQINTPNSDSSLGQNKSTGTSLVSPLSGTGGGMEEGSATRSGNSANRDENTFKGKEIGAGGYSRGGGVSGNSGGELQNTGIDFSSTHTQNKEFTSNSGIQNSDVMTTADPEHYFSLIDINDNIFKIIEKRYRQKVRDWILDDSKK